MAVRQVTDGMSIEREHFYVIPPGTYLSVDKGALRLSVPEARHGQRLPFDFLLHSLAEEWGSRAICVIFRGPERWQLGLKAIKEKGGFVIAQSPDEAGFDGMPLSAIATGAVDLVLSAADIPGALIGRDQVSTTKLACRSDREQNIAKLVAESCRTVARQYGARLPALQAWHAAAAH